MNKNRKARELAEIYVFGNKESLTSEDIQIIKRSPFANVITEEEKTPFIELVEAQLKKVNEQSLQQTAEETKTEPNMTTKSSSSRTNRFYSGVSREEIIELIRAIEEKFDLEVPYRYSKLNTPELREFIKTYAERNVFDEPTLKLILKVSQNEHPEEIMGGLRVNIGR
jgi:hypothetical protein